jgi:hypothetical protein
MTRRARFLLRSTLPALLLALPVAHAAASPDPTLAQAQAAMDRLFDEAIADRPASDSSRLVAEAFRPRLQAVSGCLPVTDAGPSSMDCIVTAEDGGDAVHRLLRFSQVDGTWALLYTQQQRQRPAPVPPTARVQVLLREGFAARLAREQDAGTRADLTLAMNNAEVLDVRNCAVGDDAPVIECTVRAGAGSERGEQTMAFAWRDGQWVNAPQP